MQTPYMWEEFTVLCVRVRPLHGVLALLVFVYRENVDISDLAQIRLCTVRCAPRRRHSTQGLVLPTLPVPLRERDHGLRPQRFSIGERKAKGVRTENLWKMDVFRSVFSNT